MKAASAASYLAAIIIGGGECVGVGSLSAPTAFIHPQQRQTIGGATTTTMATTKSAPALVTLFASENEDGDIGGDEGRRPGEEIIGEGKPIELESLRGQSSSFMGLEPLGGRRSIRQWGSFSNGDHRIVYKYLVNSRSILHGPRRARSAATTWDVKQISISDLALLHETL